MRRRFREVKECRNERLYTDGRLPSYYQSSKPYLFELPIGMLEEAIELVGNEPVNFDELDEPVSTHPIRNI